MLDAAAGRGVQSVIEEAMRGNSAQTLGWIQSLPADAAREDLLERALKAYPPSTGGGLTPQ